MSNIYNIQQDILSIFNELEENGGDLTPELEERLNIKKEEFKDKIKSYAGVIKMLEHDISDIKEEKTRLNDLQKSKEKSIERLKKVMIYAIGKFGDTTKNGSKFIDYGTGKVSIRTTQTVEVNEDSANRFLNRIFCGLKWYADNNQLSRSLIDISDVMSFANSRTQEEENNDVETDEYSLKDIEHLSASINLDINIRELIDSEEGINLLRGLLDYNMFKAEIKADKKAIKDDAKSEQHYIPVFAKIVNNENLNIK